MMPESKPHSPYCFLNGRIIRYGDCRLHISDLQFQRGYGIFDFFRIVEGRIPWLNDYTARLFNSLRLSGISWDLTPSDLKTIVGDLLQRNSMEYTAFKVLVTGGYSDTLDMVTGPANVAILQVPWKRPEPVSFLHGVNLVSDHFLRPNPEIKTLNYFNSMRLRDKKKEFQAVDILFHQEFISECSRANVFFVKEGQVFTPAKNILPGITRKQILALFPEIETRDLPYDLLFEMDEMFLTSTSREVTPVVSVDGHRIGSGIPGPVSRDIQAAFTETLLKSSR